MDTSWQCEIAAQKTKQILLQKKSGQQGEECHSAPLERHQCWITQHKKEMELVEWVQRRASRK